MGSVVVPGASLKSHVSFADGVGPSDDLSDPGVDDVEAPGLARWILIGAVFGAALEFRIDPRWSGPPDR